MLRTAALLVAIAAVLAIPAGAGAAFPGFKTPTNNVHCMGYRGELRCDIYRTTNGTPRRPSWCDFDWGTAYAIKGGWNKGRRLCVSDSAYDSAHRVLGYGQSWHYRGITCHSRSVGLTCRNAKGHGFFLSRASQRLF